MVDDYLMSQVMSQNPMSRLTEFHCDRSKYLTMDTLNLLINQVICRYWFQDEFERTQ